MPPTTSVILDIETRHDTDLMARHGVQLKDGAFPPLLYHLPVAVAIGLMDGEGRLLGVESLGSGLLADDPCELTRAFWDVVTHAAGLVSYNGRAFDLPVMELCALRYGVAAPKHWQEQYGTRYRYSKQHLDLLDTLSNFSGATKGLTLSHVVQLLGYAGKDGGMDGSMVQQMWLDGKLEDIRGYNRADIIRTYAVWLQYARIAGRLTEPMYHDALTNAKPWLDEIRGDPYATR